MQLQWFPGHMAKTRKLITENLKLVDLVAELVDARLPLSSRNPEIDRILGSKPRVLVLNKCDIADEKANQAWLDFFKKQGVFAVLMDSASGRGLAKFHAEAERALHDVFEKDRQRGIQRHAVKLMVVGIPNVGKSSFINRLSGRAAAKTGDRPGITTAKQWIRVANQYEILDTPGILWPKFESQEVAERIAFTGGIKDEIMDIEELAAELLQYLSVHYSTQLAERYRLPQEALAADGFELLEAVGRKRGCVVSGGEIDTFRAANLVLDDFRAARIGTISLELPPK